MIRFEGKMNDDCIKFIYRIHSKKTFLLNSVLFIAWAIIFVWIAWLTSYTLVLLFLLLPLIWMISWAILIHSDKKTKQKMVPRAFIINLEEQMLIIRCEGTPEMFNSMTSVERVDDYGGWYHIVFELGVQDLTFVCQKDLLVEGTIEEFESLFEGKIVRTNV